MLTHVGVFAVDFSRIDTGKTVCFLVSGGLSAVLSRVVYVNYSSVSIRPVSIITPSATMPNRERNRF